ncbi:MAG: arylsulfatase [Rikenellaceae bacterium]
MNKKMLYAVPALTLMTVAAMAAKRQPNIIFVLTDDLGYGDVSAMDPNSKFNTVHIDKMASEGVIYTDAHTSSSVSTPSRYSVLTGRYNWRSTLKRYVFEGYDMPLITPDRQTVASMLKKQGYTTAAIGKWHLGWEWANISEGKENVDFSKPIKGGPTAIGFDYFYGIVASLDFPPYVYVENDMPLHMNGDSIQASPKPAMWRAGAIADGFSHMDMLPHTTDLACKYISEKAQGDEPFYLYLPMPAPHTPIVPTEEFLGRSNVSVYGDFVLMVDAMMGQIFETLEKSGIDDNTLVVFTSDNGCSPAANIPEMNEHDHYPNSIYRGMKADLFEGGHRVPCIVRWPAAVKPHKVDQTICLTDFYATFAAINNYKLADTEGEDSYNILSTLMSKKEVKPIREATVHHSIDGRFTIRKGEWKLLAAPDSGGWSDPRPKQYDPKELNLPDVQLYHLGDDISEQNNLIYEYPEVAKELYSLLIKYIEDGRSTPGAVQKNDPVKSNWYQLNDLMKVDIDAVVANRK